MSDALGSGGQDYEYFEGIQTGARLAALGWAMDTGFYGCAMEELARDYIHKLGDAYGEEGDFRETAVRGCAAALEQLGVEEDPVEFLQRKDWEARTYL
ncbi:MAG: hypothetical protein ABEJ72_09810 [Candidatus Aenigmatarchaeota archaeon]